MYHYHHHVDLQTREQFAVAVRELLGNRSYRAFARSLGVAHQTVSAWLSLKVSPDMKNLEKIALLRGETLDEFREWLEGTRESSPLQRVIQQIHGMPLPDVARILRAAADRIESEKERTEDEHTEDEEGERIEGERI